jgi:DNA-cytosine methyltransferase
MSCGQQALNRSGFKIDKYFASEIDKYAIKVTMSNYPETIQLGTVVNVNGFDLPKIDLLIGGSPCQSFSFAGKRKGMSTKCETEILTLEHYLELKNEGFEFEGQSYLFWEYMRLLNETKPKYFLLENVVMGEKWEKVLSRAIGVNGIHINSALVSAQNRKRIYWTNIGMQPSGLFGDLESIIKQPKDKGILLKDILEENVLEKYFLSEKTLNWFYNHSEKKQIQGCGFKFEPTDGNKKSKILTTRSGSQIDDNFIIDNINCKTDFTENNNESEFKYKKEIDESILNEKSTTIDASYYKGFGVRCGKCRQVVEVDVKIENEDIICHSGQMRSSNRPSINKDKNAGGTGPLSRTDGKTYCLDHSSFSNFIEIKDFATFNNKRLNKTIEKNNQNLDYGVVLDSYNLEIHKEKCNALSTRTDASNQTYVVDKNENVFDINLLKKQNNYSKKIRKLTPVECERLQTVKDNYTNYVSDSQRYKMLGNGWTIEVICHIFNYMK